MIKKSILSFLVIIVMLGGGFFNTQTALAVAGEGVAHIDAGADGGDVTIERGVSHFFTVVLTIGSSGITANAPNPTFEIPAGFTTPDTTAVGGLGLVTSDGNWYATSAGGGCTVKPAISSASGQVITLDVVSTCVTTDTITLYYQGTSTTAMSASPLVVSTADDASPLVVIPIAASPTITVTDTVAPTITGYTLASDNSYVDVTFSEGVYNVGNGPVDAFKFNLNFTQNTGSATDTAIGSVTSPLGGSLAGGETTVRFNLILTGTPNGDETIEITPSGSGQVYDGFGNSMLNSQTTGLISLNNQVLPIPTIDFVTPTPADDSSQLTDSIEINLATTDQVSGHYAFTNFDDSLVGWWRFENDATDDVGDSNGSWQGTETYDAGKFGTAATFDGSSYVDVNLPSAIDSSFTVSAWVNLNSITEGASLVSNAAGHVLQIGGSNRWQFDNTYGLVTATTGTWTHVVGVYDASQSLETLYVDGDVASSGGGTGSITQNINIGRRDDGVYIDGNIDDVMIFSRALSAEEVSSLYDAAGNQYDHTFTDLDSGDHTFTGYVVDTDGNKESTEERSVTLIAPVLTEVTSVPSMVRSTTATYRFSVSGDITGYEYEFESCGATVHLNSSTHVVTLSGLEAGHTYGNCNFGLVSDTGPASNELHIGSFTVGSSGSSGSYPLNKILINSPVTSKILDVSLLIGHITKIGNKGASVTQLQNDLNLLGAIPQLIADGSFGPKTNAAIKAFQTSHSLVADGIVGPKTIAVMQAVYNK